MTKCNNQTIKNAYDRWVNSSLNTLRDCYNNYSVHKENAYNYCWELFRKYNGDVFGIISYNSMVFSVGFTGEIDGKKAFFYITRDYDRYIYLEELDK